MALNPTDPTSRCFRDAISDLLRSQLDAMSARLAPVSATLAPLTEVAWELLAGGKRIRPAFGYWGYVACAEDSEVPEALWRAISAFELLHAGMLVHDDVLDAADTRRGQPAAHRQFEAWHAECGGIGDGAEFGRAMAVLLGDQLIVWSDEMAATAGLSATAWRAASPYWHQVRTEVNSGQVLDICAQYRVTSSPDASDEQQAFAVLEEKTSRYTVQRPLQFGAAAAGASPDVLAALGRYGLALGRAFQLRDDLLGIFGDERATGKPSGGDLREGKRTVLLARALAGADPRGASELAAMLGRTQLSDIEIDRARQIITDSGAPAQLEQVIAADHALAISALDDCVLTAPGREALVELARLCVQRDS